jgi:4-hydroxy-2-oxoheptanedioate aldolase
MMKLPVNLFKQQLAAGQAQVGLWLALADPYAAEVLATIGYDWLLIDGEHAPNDLRQVLAQLQAVAPYASHPIVRPVTGDAALIKQYLDIGVQTLLVPMVETGEQAIALVQATRYPPHGIRGVGSGLARVSRWNGVDNYLQVAQQEQCLLVQVENQSGLRHLDEIAAVDGVDGVFFGPADLSASLNLLGQPNHPEVRGLIEDGIRRVRGQGKAAGVLATEPAVADHYLACGANFVAVGTDTGLLVKSAMTLRSHFANAPGANAMGTTAPAPQQTGY